MATKPRKPRIPLTDRIPAGSEREILDRLDHFVRETYGTWYAFEAATQITHSTTMTWRSKEPTLPSTQNLIKLAEQGLSIDWLFTGHGPMKVRLGVTDRGAVLQEMIPHLQRLASVGHQSANEAFSKLIIKFGHDGVIERAAKGLLEDFKSTVGEYDAIQSHLDLVSHADALIRFAIEAHVADDEETVKRLRREWERHLVDHLPPDFRPGSPRWTEYWALLDGNRNTFRREAWTKTIQAQGGVGPPDVLAALRADDRETPQSP